MDLQFMETATCAARPSRRGSRRLGVIAIAMALEQAAMTRADLASAGLRKGVILSTMEMHHNPAVVFLRPRSFRASGWLPSNACSTKDLYLGPGQGPNAQIQPPSLTNEAHFAAGSTGIVVGETHVTR